jgi:hypothetical protein
MKNTIVFIAMCCAFITACQPTTEQKTQNAEKPASTPTAANDVITDLAPVTGKPVTEPVGNAKGMEGDIGDCFAADPQLDQVDLNTTPVDCTQPHTHQLYARLMLDDKPYPGRQVLIDTAHQYCDSALNSHINPDVLNYDSSYQPIFPSQAGWDEDNDRNIFCLYVEFESGSEDKLKQLTSSALTANK